jgi:hypothetical protein
MYDMTIPQFTKMLNNLSLILDKAASYADHKKIDQKVLLNARLAPDQLHLIRQVQIACDTAKGMAARLSGQEPPKHEDTEQTIAELKVRIKKCTDYMATIKKEQFNGWEKRMVPMGFMPGKGVIGAEYLPQMVLPNFYFHVTLAYEILRHNGLEIGKMDYLGPVSFRDL